MVKTTHECLAVYGLSLSLADMRSDGVTLFSVSQIKIKEELETGSNSLVNNSKLIGAQK